MHSRNTKFHSRNGIPRPSNAKTTILGATPGEIPGIDGNLHERFSFAPAFSEHFFKNWGGPSAPEILAVGSISWPRFGHFKVNNLATVGSITWPPCFEPIKIGVLGDFLVHNFQGVVQN